MDETDNLDSSESWIISKHSHNSSSEEEGEKDDNEGGDMKVCKVKG